MVAVVGDIHLNLRRYQKFELDRIKRLAKLLAEKSYTSVVLAGDLFDKARPTLEEQKAMQHFINTIADVSDVYIISGNHEAVNTTTHKTTFDYITLSNCTYVTFEELILEGHPVLLAGWSHKGKLKYGTVKSKVCVSHIRSALPPHITAEMQMDFTDKFDLVLLGDIHDKYSPKDNVHYTNSPYAISFSSASPSGSYIEFDPKTLDWQYVDTSLPQKVKLTCDVDTALKVEYNKDYLYKVIVEDTIDNLRKLRKVTNVEFVKVIKKCVVEVEEQEPVDFVELLVQGVVKELPKVTKTKVKRIIKEFT